MAARRGKEAKPRQATRRRFGALQKAPQASRRSRLRAQQSIENFQTTGSVMLADRVAHGVKVGVVIGAAGPQGGISVNPATRFAYYLRSALKPRQIAPVVVRAADGTILRTITFGPNGERTVTPGASA
jgi:hypothetical protein